MIKQYFQSFGIFQQEEIEDFLRYFVVRRLDKGDYFVKEGQPCREVAFIRSGIFRSYYTSAKGDDITYCFRFPNDMMAAYSSFITGKGSVETMHAISPAEILVIKKEHIDTLVRQNPVWIQFLRIIAEQQYLELEHRVFQLQKDSALLRYQLLLQNQPEYIQQIPLRYLASYLGVTQRHLSRIRKEVVF